MHTTPVIIKRETSEGGFIAKTPDDHPYRIASIGATESDAVANFQDSLRKWESILVTSD